MYLTGSLHVTIGKDKCTLPCESHLGLLVAHIVFLVLWLERVQKGLGRKTCGPVEGKHQER